MRNKSFPEAGQSLTPIVIPKVVQVVLVVEYHELVSTGVVLPSSITYLVELKVFVIENLCVRVLEPPHLVREMRHRVFIVVDSSFESISKLMVEPILELTIPYSRPSQSVKLGDCIVHAQQMGSTMNC